mmetsp:Transcript_8639/g.25927  ORF Transcript_8639/g.25927 Transcript_8639/m.25927 type:complete len:202 (+) Transcript_8639:3393-3998(+)
MRRDTEARHVVAADEVTTVASPRSPRLSLLCKMEPSRASRNDCTLLSVGKSARISSRSAMCSGSNDTLSREDDSSDVIVVAVPKGVRTAQWSVSARTNESRSSSRPSPSAQVTLRLRVTRSVGASAPLRLFESSRRPLSPVSGSLSPSTFSPASSRRGIFSLGILRIFPGSALLFATDLLYLCVNERHDHGSPMLGLSRAG